MYTETKIALDKLLETSIQVLYTSNFWNFLSTPVWTYHLLNANTIVRVILDKKFIFSQLVSLLALALYAFHIRFVQLVHFEFMPASKVKRLLTMRTFWASIIIILVLLVLFNASGTELCSFAWSAFFRFKNSHQAYHALKIFWGFIVCVNRRINNPLGLIFSTW